MRPYDNASGFAQVPSDCPQAAMLLIGRNKLVSQAGAKNSGIKNLQGISGAHRQQNVFWQAPIKV